MHQAHTVDVHLLVKDIWRAVRGRHRQHHQQPFAMGCVPCHCALAVVSLCRHSQHRVRQHTWIHRLIASVYRNALSADSTNDTQESMHVTIAQHLQHHHIASNQGQVHRCCCRTGAFGTNTSVSTPAGMASSGLRRRGAAGAGTCSLAPLSSASPVQPNEVLRLAQA